MVTLEAQYHDVATIRDKPGIGNEETMRIGQQGFEIELHSGSDDCLWVVFDEDGDQVGSGHQRNERAALRKARMTVAWLRSPICAWMDCVSAWRPGAA